MAVSVWGFSGTVPSLSCDRRERERWSEGGRDGGGERDTQRQRQREGGMEGEGERERARGRERNFKGGRKFLFLLPPRKRERVVEGRAGGRERMTKGQGGRERESVGGRDRRGGEGQRYKEREGRRKRERDKDT